MKGFTIIFTLMYFFQGLLFFMSFYFGDGLIFFDEQSRVYKSVKTLQSSGGDDDISIALLGCISLMICFVFLLKKWSLKWIGTIVLAGVFFQLLSLLLIEVGSIFSTIIVGNDIYLTGAVLCQIVILLFLIFKVIKIGGLKCI